MIASVERLVPELSAAEQLEVHNALVSLWKTLHQHLLSPQVGQTVAPSKPADTVLTLEEAAARLRRSRSWLYHHWRALRLGYRDGGRVRFSQSCPHLRRVRPETPADLLASRQFT
jgi:hypothetical protein